MGGTYPGHIREGQFIKSLLYSETSKSVREKAISEYNYSISLISFLLNEDQQKYGSTWLRQEVRNTFIQ